MEVARELKLPKYKKQEFEKKQTINQKNNDRARRELQLLRLLVPSKEDIKKYLLWEELGSDSVARACPYCGRPISASQLISNEIEIEHILPYSKTLLNTRDNLTVAHRECNQVKGQRTPYEAFSSNPEGYNWQDIVARAQRLPANKRIKFAPDALQNYLDENQFLQKQLSDNAYISRSTKQYLAAICDKKRIWVSTGRLTAMLRGFWGLNTLLNKDHDTWFKNRFDHRHHALDALTIGLCDRGLINRIARLNSQGKYAQIVVPEFPFERSKVAEKLKKLVVSPKGDHGKEGKIFKETAMGCIKKIRKINPEELEETMINDIIPPAIRGKVQELVKSRTFRAIKSELPQKFTHFYIAEKIWVTTCDVTALSQSDIEEGRVIDPHIRAALREFYEKNKEVCTTNTELAKKLKEFSQIYNILERIANNISNYINDLYYEISSKTSEIFEINKALVLLNKCKDVESLIDKSMKFLKTDLGLNTIDIGECNEILKNCNFCKLKKITVRVDDKDYGFCVDLSDNKEESKKEMVDIFQELFAINMSRIINTLKIRETNLEYVHLSEILMSLLAQKNVNEIFNLILEKAKDICKADASYIGVYDKSTGNIVLKFFMNINTDEFKSLKFNKNQGLGGLVIRERRGIFIQNYFTDHRIDSPFKDIVKKEGIISTIAVPIFYQDEIYGILYVGYRTMKKDITYELSFLQKMSTAAAIAIERENNINELKNKELELRKAYEELVERRKEINELLKGYKDANLELERSNRELVEQYEIVKKSYEELNSLNKAKDLFLGILSHELKTPITIVKGYIETLLSKDFYLDNKVKSALTTALKSVNNLSEKVDDLLDYMRLETKKLKLYFKEISFREIFRDIANELYPFLEERKQKIIIKDSDFKFKGDVKWLKKAFASVINNSIKFSPDGKNIYIDFEVVEREKLIVPYYVKEKPVLSNKYLIISIRDEGVGIPESEINKIFDSFYELGDIRTHSTGKYKFMAKGVGLGLSFTKQIISMHNGIVYAESDGFDVEKCPGTIIKIVLPMDEEKIVEDKKKESILIIDSDYDFSRFLELFLSQKYSVYLFDDGGVGYLKILEIKPKLVMINVSLKNYDGYEVCSIIKEDKNIKDIPVILYGTGPESFDEIRAQKVKANMIFYPIFDTENLLRVVEYYMKR